MKCFPLNIICVLLFVISSITNNVQGEHTHTHTQCQQYKELSGDCGGNDIKWIRDKSTTECINECNKDANCAGFTYAHGNVDGRVGSNGCCLKSKSCGTPAGVCDPTQQHCFHAKPTREEDCETRNNVDDNPSTGYFLGEYGTNFEDAKQYCEERGSMLAIIKNEYSQHEAAEICGTHSCWIGLVEHGDRDGTWKWLDGETLSYDNWEDGEPNNYGGKDEKNGMMNCCSEEADLIKGGKWVDVKKEDLHSSRPLCGIGGEKPHDDGGVGGLIALIILIMLCGGVITCIIWCCAKRSNGFNQPQNNVIGVTSPPHMVQQVQMVPQQRVQKVTAVQQNGQPIQGQGFVMQNGQPMQGQGFVMSQPIQGQGFAMQNGQPMQGQGFVMSQPIQGQGYITQQPGMNNFNNRPSIMMNQSATAPEPVVVQATYTNSVNRQNI